MAYEQFKSAWRLEAWMVIGAGCAVLLYLKMSMARKNRPGGQDLFAGNPATLPYEVQRPENRGAQDMLAWNYQNAFNVKLPVGQVPSSVQDYSDPYLYGPHQDGTGRAIFY